MRKNSLLELLNNFIELKDVELKDREVKIKNTWYDWLINYIPNIKRESTAKNLWFMVIQMMLLINFFSHFFQNTKVA